MVASVHDPFADAGNLLSVPCACGNGVKAPVNEHAKSCLAPPGHTRIVLRRGFRVLDGFYAMLICHVVVLTSNLGRHSDRGGEHDRQ